jgi:tetratricopeptide (TPR) repeat protein
MNFRTLPAALLFACAALAATPASAYVGALCADEPKTMPEKIIASCDDVITGNRVYGHYGAWVPAAYYFRGRANERLGRNEQALRDYLTAIKADNSYVDAYQAFGVLEEKLGHDGEAMSMLDTLVQAHPGDYHILNGVCWARATLGRQLDVAVSDCEAALNVMPDDADTLDSLCLVRYRKAEYGNAIAACNAALQRNAALPNSLYVRGLAELRAGLADAGNADIAKAKAIRAGIAGTYAAWGVTP